MSTSSIHLQQLNRQHQQNMPSFHQTFGMSPTSPTTPSFEHTNHLVHSNNSSSSSIINDSVNDNSNNFLTDTSTPITLAPSFETSPPSLEDMSLSSSNVNGTAGETCSKMKSSILAINDNNSNTNNNIIPRLQTDKQQLALTATSVSVPDSAASVQSKAQTCADSSDNGQLIDKLSVPENHKLNRKGDDSSKNKCDKNNEGILGIDSVDSHFDNEISSSNTCKNIFKTAASTTTAVEKARVPASESKTQFNGSILSRRQNSSENLVTLLSSTNNSNFISNNNNSSSELLNNEPCVSGYFDHVISTSTVQTCPDHPRLNSLCLDANANPVGYGSDFSDIGDCSVPTLGFGGIDSRTANILDEYPWSKPHDIDSKNGLGCGDRDDDEEEDDDDDNESNGMSFLAPHHPNNMMHSQMDKHAPQHHQQHHQQQQNIGHLQEPPYLSPGIGLLNSCK